MRASARLTWLVRRIGRMYWQEVPFRAGTVVRSLLQSRGWRSASVPPPRMPDARHGQSWCTRPDNATGLAPVREVAARTMRNPPDVFGQPVAHRDGIPDWNADPVTGRPIPLSFGLFLDFRHIEGIDIKHLWELNRHLWLVPLAQAWAVGHEPRYLAHLGRLLEQWLDACPYPLGANWSSPVEHGIRLINWSLAWNLIGGADSPLFSDAWGRALRERWLTSVYQHMRFASDNYSFYSSADNHLIGEAAGIFVASHTWDCWDEGRRMRLRAKRILEEETLKQFSADGVNLEQALCYHKFSLQFLLASGLCGRANGDDFSRTFWTRVEAAIVFLAAVTDAAGQVPRFGDSDDGDVWRLAVGPGTSGYQEVMAIGARLFGNEALTAKCHALGGHVLPQADWVFGVAPPAALPRHDALALARLPRAFPVGGYVVLGRRLHAGDEVRVLMDCGPLGYNRIGGHAHADALSVVVSVAGEQFLVDPGTYCYNAAPQLRHFFRGTSAHNTLTVDGQDQSIYGASFLWLRDVHTTIEQFDDAGRCQVQAYHDGYLRLRDPVRHHRRAEVATDDTIIIEDWLACSHPHRVSLLWHCAAGVAISPLADGSGWQIEGAVHGLRVQVDGASCAPTLVTGQHMPPQGWVSTDFYSKRAAAVLVWAVDLKPNQVLRTTLTPLLRRPAAAASSS